MKKKLDKVYCILYIPIMRKTVELQTANMTDYYSVPEAAGKLRITTGTIREYLRLGKFTRYKFKTLTLISKTELDGWIR